MGGVQLPGRVLYTSAMAKDGKELILRLQYPEEVGAVGECELEGILSRLQQVRVLKR